MPVKLPECALDQVLLGGGDGVAVRVVRDDLLPDPASGQDAGVGVGEAPLHVGDDAVVSRLRAEVVRVLEIELLISPAYRGGRPVSRPCLPQRGRPGPTGSP